MRSHRLAGLVVIASAVLLSPAVHARRCPNVMFVVAASEAMLGPRGNGTPPTYFDLTRQAVSSAANIYTSMPLGLELFSSTARDDAQCFLDTAVTVPVGAGSGPSIRRALYAASAGGSTNLGDAIRRAAEDGHLDDPRRENVIIVFTAAADDCHTGPPGSQYAIDQVRAAAAHNPPIHTVIIAYGQDVVSPVLNAMAVAGGFANGCDPNGNKPCYCGGGGGVMSGPNCLLEVVTGLAWAGNPEGVCDDSCFANPGDCAAGQVCAFPAPSTEPTCVPDPCLHVSCGAGQYCRKGQCTNVCPPCPHGQYCVNGTCTVDKCDGAKWNDALQYCAPETGLGPSRCATPLNCPLLTYCDPATGACTDNPCRLINCPAHSSCNPSGWCEADAPRLDMASGPDLTADAPVDAAGQPEPSTSGCSCRVAVADGRWSGDSLAILLGLGVLVHRRRRA